MNGKLSSRPGNRAATIASYVAFLAMSPGQPEQRKQLADQVVSDCYGLYYWAIYRKMRMMNLRHEDAEDGLQQVFIRWTQQLEAADKLPVPEALLSWLLKLASWTAMTHYRSLPNRGAEREYAARHTQDGRRAEGERPGSDDLQQFEAVIGLLGSVEQLLRQHVTERASRVLVSHTAGRTLEKIAEALGVSEKTARLDLTKARDVLRAELPRSNG
jgi:RNA polymerase sigma factor (sigma-70 family)